MNDYLPARLGFNLSVALCPGLHLVTDDSRKLGLVLSIKKAGSLQLFQVTFSK